MNVFDLHCDTIVELCREGDGLINEKHHISLSRAPFRRYAQAFAICPPDDLRGQAAADFLERQLRYFRAQLEEHQALIGQARSVAELDALHAQGKAAALLAVEGGSVLMGELSRIAYLREQGVVFLTLTWNAANELGGGAATNAGLTSFGKAAVAELHRCGIMPDVSHLSDHALEDLFACSPLPVLATHSNSRAQCSVARNLRDDHFQEIVRRGGLVGINFYTHFLREQQPEQADFRDILRHVEHFLALGGENTLALGSDFDGADVPDCLNSVEKIANLHAFMVQSITDQALVEKLFFGNAHRFFEEHFK